MTKQEYHSIEDTIGKFLTAKTRYDAVRKKREELIGDGQEISIMETLGESIMDPVPPRSYEEIGEAVTNMFASFYQDEFAPIGDQSAPTVAAWDSLFRAVTGKSIPDILKDAIRTMEEERSILEDDIAAYGMDVMDRG